MFSIQQQEESPLNVTVADASRTSTCIMASVSVKSVASMSLEHGDSRPQLILYFDNCREKRKSSEVFSIPISQLALLIPIVEDHETSCTFLPWMCSLSDWEFRDQCTSTTTSSTMTYSSSTMTASSFTATASSTVQARLRAGMASAYFTKPSSLCYLMSHEMRSDSATKCEDECIPHASHDCDGYTYQDGICRLRGAQRAAASPQSFALKACLEVLKLAKVYQEPASRKRSTESVLLGQRAPRYPAAATQGSRGAIAAPKQRAKEQDLPVSGTAAMAACAECLGVAPRKEAGLGRGAGTSG